MPVACAQAQSMARPVLKNEKRQAAAAAALEKEHPELQGQILAPEAPKLTAKKLVKDGSIIKVR